MIAYTALRVGALTLTPISEANAAALRARIAALPGIDDELDDLLTELEDEYLPEYDDDGRQTLYGFYAERDGELAGMSLLRVDSWDDLRGSTGADTFPHMRGQRIAPGSKPVLFYVGFHLLGLNRIETATDVTNTASIRSIEKTPGFVYEGTLREYTRGEDGTLTDQRWYGLLRRDWQRLYRLDDVEVIA